MDHPEPNTEQDRVRTREAVRLFQRLEEHPDDPEAKRDLVAFLARGPEERAAYARLSRALKAARAGLRPKQGRSGLLLLAVGLAAGLAAYGPARDWLRADHSTGTARAAVTLASGDGVTLDARSALKDDSGGAIRDVDLLHGAAFFDVEQDGRRFIVAAGPIQAEALGTQFEVARLGPDVLVSVGEGTVQVNSATASWRLEAGDRLRWSPDGLPQRDQIAPETVAQWRSDQLSIDGMRFGQVVAVLDRHIPGQIFVLDSELAAGEISGGLDLSRPLDALRALAATSGARVIALPPLGTVVLR